MLQSTADDFMQRLNDNYSLRPLYSSSPLTIKVQSGDRDNILMFSTNGCERLNNSEGKNIDVTISGEMEALERLLAGKERLLALKKQQLLQVEGPYRLLLKLESLFILNGGDKDFFKKGFDNAFSAC